MDRLEREVRAVIEDYQAGDRMPEARMDAAWSRLQAAIAADDAPVSERPRHAHRAWALVMLLAAAVVLALAGHSVLDRRAQDSRPQEAVHGAPSADETPVREARPRGPAGSEASSEHVPEDRVERTVQAPTRGRPAPARTEGPAGLDAEVALLRSAREALARGRADEALALLADHARRFADGHLAEERARLRVQALCESGARAEAQAEAQAFAEARPESAHARKILRVCADP